MQQPNLVMGNTNTTNNPINPTMSPQTNSGTTGGNNMDNNQYLLQFLHQQLVNPTQPNTLRPNTTRPMSGMPMNNGQMDFSTALMGDPNTAGMMMTGQSQLNTSNTGNPLNAPPNNLVQRSGTPLSNNSGGVQSTNTTTTNNTQSGASNGMRRFTVEQIKLVQQMIEQCLKLYLSKQETMEFLCKKYQNVEPGFINLMWSKLEQQNPEFFKAYNTRLQIKEQISQFNALVKEQALVMQQQGVLVQNNTNNMNSNNQPMSITSNTIGGLPQSNIPSSFTSSSPVGMNLGTFNSGQGGYMVNNTGMMANQSSGNNGAFVFPNGIPSNAANSGAFMNQQSNMNGSTNTFPSNSQSGNLIPMYRQPNAHLPHSNSFNNTSPQKRSDMNGGLENMDDHQHNNLDVPKMISQLLHSPNTLESPHARHVIQNFLKSPLVAKIDKDTEEKLRSLLPNDANMDPSRATNSTPVTTNSGGTSTPAMDQLSNSNSITFNNNSVSQTNTAQTSSQQDATSNPGDVFDVFPPTDNNLGLGSELFDDYSDIFRHDFQ